MGKLALFYLQTTHTRKVNKQCLFDTLQGPKHNGQMDRQYENSIPCSYKHSLCGGWGMGVVVGGDGITIHSSR